MAIASRTPVDFRGTKNEASPPLGWMTHRGNRSVLWVASTVAGLTFSGVGSLAPRAESGLVEAKTPRVATRTTTSTSPLTTEKAVVDSVSRAKRAIADCRIKYEGVRDYTCTFQKRERVDGKLLHAHIMDMKARKDPASIYFKFRTPDKGREAIYVAGQNGGKVMAHDMGIGKFLAGTMALDPIGEMAMEECRHPITEAGLGALIETVIRHWDAELTPEESVIAFNPNVRIGTHGCTMIETVHPSRQPHFLYHVVRLYISREHGLPIRYEAFDWPSLPGASPELVEQYSYLDLKLNVGLADLDFDVANRAYSFGRF